MSRSVWLTALWRKIEVFDWRLVRLAREGVESMAQFLQQHAGFHFRLALVELALFEVAGGYIAQPRVLAKTTNIERGILKLAVAGATIEPSIAGTQPNNLGRRTTITEEEYFEQLDKLFPGVSHRVKALVEELEPHNVTAEFGTESMMLKWRPEDGKTWNFATIPKPGWVWLDYLGRQAESVGLLDLHKQYLATLEGLVPGACIKKTVADFPPGATWRESPATVRNAFDRS